MAVRVPKGTLTPRVLVAPKIDTVRTPLQLATPVPEAVVVVNGSVFDPVRLGIPVESQIVGKAIRKGSRTLDSSLAIWGADNRLDVINAQTSGNVIIGSSTWSVGAVNWQSVVTTGLTVYTYSWGRTAHPAGPVSVVLQGGKVVAKRTGTAARLPAASGQFVVTAPSGALSVASTYSAPSGPSSAVS